MSSHFIKESRSESIEQQRQQMMNSGVIVRVKGRMSDLFLGRVKKNISAFGG